MKCPICKDDKPEGMVYRVSWKAWRNKSLETWKASRNNKRYSTIAKKRMAARLEGGYVGVTCHWCNKITHVAESNALDHIILEIQKEEKNDRTNNQLC